MTHFGIHREDDWRPKAERVLASVREDLRDATPHDITPETALDALRRYLLLCRTPEHREFDPTAVVSALAGETSTETCVVEVEPTGPCFGDPDQIIEIIRLLRDNASLEKDACLYIEAFEKDHLPQSAISFDGPGHFNRPLSFAGSLGMDLESLERRWTVATRGGRFDKAPNGLILRFKGMREIPPLPVVPPEFDTLLQSVVTTLHSEKTQGIAGMIDDLLLILDTPTASAQPADISALIKEVCVQAQARFQHDGIILRCELSNHVPPIAMVRARMAVCLQSLMALIDYVLPDGGSVDLTLDYDSDERNAQMMDDRKSTRLNSSHTVLSRMPSSA